MLVFGDPFLLFFKHDTQKHDFWTPLGIQLGPKLRPKSAKWRQNVEKKFHLVLQKRVPESTLLFLKPQ